MTMDKVHKLFQKDTTAQLHCPAGSKHGLQGAGYATLAKLLEGFGNINCLPKRINLACFDDGEALKVHCTRIELNGMMHVDFNITRPS